jgi:hypothetical protein
MTLSAQWVAIALHCSKCVSSTSPHSRGTSAETSSSSHSTAARAVKALSLEWNATNCPLVAMMGSTNAGAACVLPLACRCFILPARLSFALAAAAADAGVEADVPIANTGSGSGSVGTASPSQSASCGVSDRSAISPGSQCQPHSQRRPTSSNEFQRPSEVGAPAWESPVVTLGDRGRCLCSARTEFLRLLRPRSGWLVRRGRQGVGCVGLASAESAGALLYGASGRRLLHALEPGKIKAANSECPVLTACKFESRE